MVLLYNSNGVKYGLSTGKTLQKILFVPLSISVLLISEQLLSIFSLDFRAVMW